MIHDAISGRATFAYEQFSLRVESKEKTRSKCEVISECGIYHHELPIVLLKPNTSLESKILIKDAVNG